MPTRPLRLAPEWDDRFTRMLGVSAVAHVVALAALVIVARRIVPRSLPLVAYTVEITDPSALGGRMPAGAPGPDLTGGPVDAPPAEPKAPPAPAEAPPPVAPEPPAAKAAEAVVPVPEPPKAPEPPAPEPTPVVATPEPPPVKPPPPKPAEPKPVAKAPEPKPEPKKLEPKKPEPKKAEPAKPAVAKAEPKPAAPPAVAGKQAPASGSAPAASEATAPRDAYSAAAERWRSRAGGGLGGSDTGSGPVGAGGEGKGGGGQLVGLEFLAYRQQVINGVKARWSNVIGRPGLVASVFFEIAPDGHVSGIRIHQSSGNAAYDSSALRAVQHANPLPAPPGAYAKDFREFVIEFHSEEQGGQGAG